MAVKTGDVFYYVNVNPDYTPMTSLHTYTVSCIRKDTVYLISKIDGITWVKDRVGKKGKWGWAKNISHWFKKKFKIGHRPKRYSPTKRGAYLVALRSAEEYVRKWGHDFDEHEAEQYRKAVASLKSQYAKHKKAGK